MANFVNYMNTKENSNEKSILSDWDLSSKLLLSEDEEGLSENDILEMISDKHGISILDLKIILKRNGR